MPVVVGVGRAVGLVIVPIVEMQTNAKGRTALFKRIDSGDLEGVG